MPKSIIILLISILTFIFLFHFYITRQAVYGDGIYYYAYNHSLVKDHDLNFRDEFGHHYSPLSNNALQNDPLDESNITKTGMRSNIYPIGAPLFWLIPYAVLDVIANSIHYFNHSFPNNGYSDLYQIGIGIVNILFIILGLQFLYLFLQNFFTKRIALLSTLLLIAGTNLLYYGSFDVINSHPSSFLVSCFFCFYWWKTREKRKFFSWAVLSMLVAVLTMIRTQDIAFFTLLLADLSLKIKNHQLTLTTSLKIIALILCIFILSFLPQMIVWNILFGSFWQSPYSYAENGFHLFQPQILGVLLNYKTGLVWWTPLLVCSFIGIFLLKKKNKQITYYAIFFPILELYFIASWSGWMQGEAFGIRMLIATFPFFAIGTAALLSRFKQNIQYIICVVFFVYNLSAISYFTLFIHSATYDRGRITKTQSYNKIEKIFNTIIHVI